MHDSDDLINSAFDEFSATAATRVTIAGTGAIRATVRRRKMMRATAFGTLGALLIAVPVATYAVTSHGSTSPPAATPSTVAAASPSTMVPTPSQSPAGASPAPSSPTSSTPYPAGGKITIGELTAGTVTIPAWLHHYGPDDAPSLCPSGRQRLAADPAGINDGGIAPPLVAKVVYTNLDSDAAPETAALIVCQWGEVAVDKVVAFDRAPSGAIVTLGTVAEGVIWDMSARHGGGVTINISDMQSCCSEPNAMELHQTRSYAWTGSHFTQVAGPTRFIGHPKPIKFTFSATSSSWSAPKAGARTGTVTITITNPSAYTSNPLLIWDDGSTTPGPGMKTGHALKPGASEHVSLTVTVETNTPRNQALLNVYEIGAITIGGGPDTVKYPLW